MEGIMHARACNKLCVQQVRTRLEFGEEFHTAPLLVLAEGGAVLGETLITHFAFNKCFGELGFFEVHCFADEVDALF